LGRPGDVDVHPVEFAVAVGVEVGLDPELLTDPGIGVRELGNDLGLAVHEDRADVRSRRLDGTR
jgi:hypothetical protein